MTSPSKNANKHICVQHDFRQSLGEDWVDVDVAMYYLGIHIGIIDYNDGGFAEAKHIFWTNNPRCNTLYDMLALMNKLGTIDLDEEALKVKWKK